MGDDKVLKLVAWSAADVILFALPCGLILLVFFLRADHRSVPPQRRAPPLLTEKLFTGLGCPSASGSLAGSFNPCFGTKAIHNGVAGFPPLPVFAPYTTWPASRAQGLQEQQRPRNRLLQIMKRPLSSHKSRLVMAAMAAGGQEVEGNEDSASGRSLFLGIDFGTSGARAAVVDANGARVAEAACGYRAGGAEGDWAGVWRSALVELLTALPAAARADVRAVAFDGTSATTLIVDAETGKPLCNAMLYNEAMPATAVDAVKEVAPPNHTTTSSTSSLAKAVHFLQTISPLSSVSSAESVQSSQGARLLHQADWLAWLLHGRMGVSDHNNALKLGYDPDPDADTKVSMDGRAGGGAYPSWITDAPEDGGLGLAELIPREVLPPGVVQGTISSASPLFAAGDVPQLLPVGCKVIAGTTDSIAAFVAASAGGGADSKREVVDSATDGVDFDGSGADEGGVGVAVTSLGSTMAIKMTSATRVDDARYGIYSHRLNGRWLVGGASNTGGAVLKHLGFSDADLRQLSEGIDPNVSSPASEQLYPLVRPGERFPINDDSMLPRNGNPEPNSEYLHAVLEAIARIEAEAFDLLHSLGADPVRRVLTAGGGAKNEKWLRIRARMLGGKVPVNRADEADACVGAALLARQGGLGLNTYALDATIVN